MISLAITEEPLKVGDEIRLRFSSHPIDYSSSLTIFLEEKGLVKEILFEENNLYSTEAHIYIFKNFIQKKLYDIQSINRMYISKPLFIFCKLFANLYNCELFEIKILGSFLMLDGNNVKYLKENKFALSKDDFSYLIKSNYFNEETVTQIIQLYKNNTLFDKTIIDDLAPHKLDSLLVSKNFMYSLITDNNTDLLQYILSKYDILNIIRLHNTISKDEVRDYLLENNVELVKKTVDNFTELVIRNNDYKNLHYLFAYFNLVDIDKLNINRSIAYLFDYKYNKIINVILKDVINIEYIEYICLFRQISTKYACSIFTFLDFIDKKVLEENIDLITEFILYGLDETFNKYDTIRLDENVHYKQENLILIIRHTLIELNKLSEFDSQKFYNRLINFVNESFILNNVKYKDLKNIKKIIMQKSLKTK